MRTKKIALVVLLTVVLAGGGAIALALSRRSQPPVVSPSTHVIATLRQLRPSGQLIRVGNFPGGAAITPDGAFYWTVSAGYTDNGVQIVSTQRQRVVQTVKLPGASGGVAIDGAHGLAYVSGEPDTDITEVKLPSGTPGRSGDVIHVLRYAKRTGRATPVTTIAVPPPPGAPALDAFPPAVPPEKRAWPERLAVSPDGSTLLVALGLADAAAVVDTRTKAVRYVPTGSHPFGAAILPDGHTGLVSNRGTGTVSVIDLGTAKKLKDIQAGPHLSHPETIELDPAGTRAFVPLANGDAVAVIDARRLVLERTLSTARGVGAGTAPVHASVTPDGRELLVAESAADEVAVFALPVAGTGVRPAGAPFALIGRVPTADYPTDARAVGAGARVRCRLGSRAARRRACAKLLWTAAKGFGLGPNPSQPITGEYKDVPARATTKGLVTGYAGIDDLPDAKRLRSLTATADAQLVPVTHVAPPPDTPLRPGGPIKHVFYIVRENRTYDQVLGDDPRGDGNPSYALFGQQVTPNAHALVRRFPLFDRFYADSEASIDGHYLTAAGNVSDYVHRTWRQSYAGRKYPSDAWFYQIAYPQTGFLFDRADAQGVSWVNLGEGVVHLAPLPDRDKSSADNLGVLRRYAKSDLGAITPGGCYDPFIGTDELTGAAKVPIRLYDSSKPVGAPLTSLSRYDCFNLKFTGWELTNSLPSLVYMTLPNDHTNGASPGHHTPRAMIADNDRALGQVIDRISHSQYWGSSAIFVVEDDSQDGIDHQDAHRSPALVVSPYAKRGAVIHTPYDYTSVLRSIELILGLRPLSLFDAEATPMYAAFDARPQNSEPWAALPPTYPLLEENPARPTSAAARDVARRNTTIPDRVPQRLLDRVLWKSVHGPRSEPPPAGPNAVGEGAGG
jgi:DNA-binding beta-propeller fold protein YncE